MKKKFIEFIKKYSLFTREEPLLLACSGGVDSMVLFHLLKESGYTFSVAHCNFSLRGKESDGDSEFVKRICTEHKIKFHYKKFDTKKFAKENKFSIEQAARELRYKWFAELAKKNKYSKILTAHHADDHVETVLLNVIRGTSLAGLAGIRPKKENIIRPLLFAKREEILKYAREKKIQWREDSSNESNEYKRNFLRHEIIPLIKKMNPGITETMFENSQLSAEISDWVQKEFDKEKMEAVKKKEDKFLISIEKIKKCATPKTLLQNILQEFGFGNATVRSIFLSMDSEPGKKFFKNKFEVIIRKKFLEITEI